MPESSGASLAKILTWTLGLRGVTAVGSHLALSVPLTLGRTGAGLVFLMHCSFTTSSSPSSVMQVGALQNFVDQ